ncbi:glycoside hydrolase family 28 protein [Algibacter amylolyticus]|uniref:Glycoside hydrolase family 28 protein n=1 Tax=Algibacter amylolyticus TaxID=1608400 RepID=A0A5M7BEI5_9FLAO|nr:glycoside hydrolase family 28 protein [Algibacter amylolyticus]KAA5827986.1 glycoside hydrolase family 28 protein [Algibacter amylolyticus]MBB5267226.1 polygalacturonase [Algibacter amylolyticus]TSJ82231.1 glycoside hydrolase family 28 protein [Algibacter amylolyticus]
MKIISHSSLYTLICLSVILLGLNSCKEKEKAVIDVFNEADKIISSIKVLEFPDNTFNILDFGAIADGETNNSQAIKKAIGACNESGGGKVVIPPGKFLTGAIYLKSNVNLHLEAGAEVLFSTSTEDYLPVVHTSYEGQELMNYSPLIYAYKEKNIAVTGKGTFNGQASKTNWWPWCGAERYGYVKGDRNQRDEHNLPRLWEMAESNIPVSERVFGPGHQLRPLFMQPFECENVLIEGVTFTNAPFWVIHPIKCNYVRVDGVTVNSHGPNNDGCDPEYSKNVHIVNCVFNTGDDCIAIKSGRNNDGRRVNISSENIVIENCDMIDGHGGVVMGSEISAGVRNVFVRNCKMNSPELDRAIRIKTNTLRGGFVENVYVKDIEVGQVKEAVLKINLFYAIYGPQEGDFMPSVKNIHLDNINVKNGGQYGVLIKGRPQSLVNNVTLTNVHIQNVETPLSVENSEPIIFKNTSINGKQY